MVIKTITIKKRGGGTRKQKVQVLKSGKFKFIKNSTKRKATKRKTPLRKGVKRRVSGSGKKRKVIKQKTTPKRQMVGKKNIVSKTFGNPTLKKVLMAAGAVSVATSIAAIAIPSLVPTLQKPIVKAVLGFAAGDVVGGASQFLLNGGIGSIQNIVGGGNGQQTVNNSGGNGFA